ncbi:MAG: hypothetical protein JNM76_10145 [Betaproteobacteria bacterium]|nr:hypothetical protein [Betaproteobacteria bacterium]
MNTLKKALALTGVATLGAATSLAHAADEHTLATKVSLFSEYEYRGITQTSEKPALQLNVDYSHSSGFYLGFFGTNIKWLKDYKDEGFVSKDAKVELDFFGGYKFEVVKDLTLDVGYLRYEYPNMKALPGLPKANTDEIYLGATYGPVTLKYSHSTSDLFGYFDSKGSTFIEANFSQEIAPKLTLVGNIGRQKIKNNEAYNYTVYKIGMNYDLGNGWTTGGYVKDTNAKSDLYTVKGKDWGKSRLVAFVSKSF